MLLVCLLVFVKPACAQDFNLNSVVYNTLVGAFSGGIGAMINKPKEAKPGKAFLKGFLTGGGGGLVMYGGKKLNFLVSQKQNLGYAWMSRAVYSAGNSVVENVAAGRPFWSQWHYDAGFVRLEFQVSGFRLRPRLMPSHLAGMLFMARNGRLDLLTTLKSGTFTYRTGEIGYSPGLVGSTTSNGFLLGDTLQSGRVYYDVYAHEMIHAFQFNDLSGINYFFKPLTDKWGARSGVFRNVHKWVHGDLNYEAMLLNYFLINRGASGYNYCRNYLENEAEFLSTGRPACN